MSIAFSPRPLQALERYVDRVANLGELVRESLSRLREQPESGERERHTKDLESLNEVIDETKIVKTAE